MLEVKPNNNTTMSVHVPLIPANLDWLKNIAKSFERIVWHSCKLWFTPAVGATKNGMLAYGVDYEVSESKKPSHSQVSALTPSISHACWQSSLSKPLVIPQKMLQSRKWYVVNSTDLNDQGPGTLLGVYNGDAVTYLGDFWIEYDVELSGTVF